MDREEALKELIATIELLASDADNETKKVYSDRTKAIMEGLNSCDSLWVGDKYSKWWEKVFYPRHKDKIDAIKSLTKSK